MGAVTCPVCGGSVVQPPGRGRPRMYCSVQCKDRAKRRSSAGRERERNRHRRRPHDQRTHGMGPEGRIDLWNAQGGRCYLCGTEALPEEMHIDHDHNHCGPDRSCSRCRRGLACHRCNVAIGMAGDDPARLRLIADALEAAQLAVTARLAGAPIQLELIDAAS